MNRGYFAFVRSIVDPLRFLHTVLGGAPMSEVGWKGRSRVEREVCQEFLHPDPSKQIIHEHQTLQMANGMAGVSRRRRRQRTVELEPE
jgi:hypothetical protein